MGKTWIQSLGNKRLEPMSLTAEMAGPIEEIAHSLAGEFRFTRQTQQRYSVAEHCVRGSELLPPAFAGAFLLHELSEVYLPDIAGPVKPQIWVERLERRREIQKGSLDVLSIQILDGETAEDAARAFLGLQAWADWEREHTRAILAALNLSSIEPLIYSPEVKRMDLAMLAAEKRDLCGPEPETWGLPIEPAPITIHNTWSPDGAAAAFLARFRALFT